MDKPIVQFKLSMPDTDNLRDMIRRDHADLIRRNQVNVEKQSEATVGHTKGAPQELKDEFGEIQRMLFQVEHLADIFSVTLTKR